MSLKFSYCSQSFLIENGEIIVKRVSVSKMSLYITVKLICMWWYFLMMIAIMMRKAIKALFLNY